MNSGKYDNWDDRYRADTELMFFGTITASVTHELNNVISIINQTGGLLEDLLAGAQQGREIKPEQLERIAGRIDAQSRRGIEIIQRLNGFAHTVDEPVGEIDLNELLETLIELCRRFASLRGMELELKRSEESIVIVNSSIRLQQNVYLVLKEIMGQGEKGEQVSIKLTKEGEEILINLELISERNDVDIDLSPINRHAEKIGAVLERNNNTQNFSIYIRLPQIYKSAEEE